MPVWIMQRRKAVLAAVGVALTLTSAWVDPDSAWGRAITVALAVLTVFGVHEAPNLPSKPVEGP